jgi:hypothetical protein
MNTTRSAWENVKAHAGIIILLLAVVWSVMAPWLSANQFIAVRAEVLNYKYCVLAVVCGGFRLIQGGKSGGRRQVVRWVVLVGSLLAVCLAWFLADNAFTYWKMRAVPAAAWQQAASDLERLAKEAPTMGKNQPWANYARYLPKSIQVVGLPEDYAAGHGSAGLYGAEGIVADVTYGFKPRTWGLFVGTEDPVREGPQKYRTIRVGTNAFFFVGPNY